MEEEKKIWAETREKELVEKHSSDAEFEALRLDEERAKHQDEMSLLKNRVDELERLNDQITSNAAASEVAKQELTRLKTEVKTLTEALKQSKDAAAKEMNNAINAEKIRQ